MMTVTSSSAIATLSSQRAATDDINILNLPVQAFLAKFVEPELFNFTLKAWFSFFLILVSLTTQYTSQSENFTNLSVQNKYSHSHHIVSKSSN